MIRGASKLRTSKFYFFLGLYALALAVSTFFSIAPKQSFYKLLGEYYLILLCILTFNLSPTFDFLKRITQAWLVGTSLTILATIAGFVLFYLGYKNQLNNYFLSHFGSLPTGNYPRIHALFANANMMCNFLNVSLMLSLLAYKFGWVKTIWAKFLSYGIWFAAFFTISPGVGGLFLSLGIWLWAHFNSLNKKTFAIAALNCGIILALLSLATTLVSPDTLNTKQDFKMPFLQQTFEPSVRVLIWQNSLEIIHQFPVFGQGTGTDVVDIEYRTLSGDQQFHTDAHNVWLSLLGQIGLFGLAAFISLVGFLIWRCGFQILKYDNIALAKLALTCAFIGAFWYQSIQGSFENARHLWILFGLVASLGESDFVENNNV